MLVFTSIIKNMSIDSILKKEGISIVRKLDMLEVNRIAKNITNKISKYFSEYLLDYDDLFASISRIDMFLAKMTGDSATAKYLYMNNSIYFNENVDLTVSENSIFALHECIHFLQTQKDKNGNLTRLGLYKVGHSGTAINEAAVQLMASIAQEENFDNVKYYDIYINTISPNCYPLQCALLTEMVYFTGTYPLYHSTLNSNEVFKNTFVLKSDKKTYDKIIKNFDKLLSFENNLNYYSSELQYADKISSIKLLNKLINETKNDIKSLFFKTQNLIMNKCFKSEFNNIRNLEDIKSFNAKLYNYKNIIGSSDEYTYYNEFYCNMMNVIEEKKQYIEKYGEINLFESVNTGLMLVDNTKNALTFITTFARKIKKLFGFNISNEQDINDI